jgi:hypothetical protein
MRVLRGFSSVFDDPNLVSCAGLAPVLALAERAGLHRLVASLVKINTRGWGERAAEGSGARRGDGRRCGGDR